MRLNLDRVSLNYSSNKQKQLVTSKVLPNQIDSDSQTTHMVLYLLDHPVDATNEFRSSIAHRYILIHSHEAKYKHLHTVPTITNLQSEVIDHNRVKEIHSGIKPLIALLEKDILQENGRNNQELQVIFSNL